jgi:hypothetical protein
MNSASGLGLPPLHSAPLYIVATQITDCYWSEESFLSLIGFHMRYTQQGQKEELRSDLPIQFE